MRARGDPHEGIITRFGQKTRQGEVRVPVRWRGMREGGGGDKIFQRFILIFQGYMKENL